MKSAFPYNETFTSTSGSVEWTSEDCMGMTLREYYAGLAMQGILSRCQHPSNVLDDIAKRAFNIADAMVKEATR